jgi:hypothetical protein
MTARASCGKMDVATRLEGKWRRMTRYGFQVQGTNVRISGEPSVLGFFTTFFVDADRVGEAIGTLPGLLAKRLQAHDVAFSGGFLRSQYRIVGIWQCMDDVEVRTEEVDGFTFYRSRTVDRLVSCAKFVALRTLRRGTFLELATSQAA